VRADRADRETLCLAYTVCKAHQGIADFRARLLALLPLASGAGIFLTLGGAKSRPSAGDLAAIGAFGFAVTLGLFVYELRGIQHCHRLRDQAAILECELDVPEPCGQFRDRTHSQLNGLVGVEAASWLVYTAVLLAWLYVAVYGTSWRVPLGITLLVLYPFVLFCWWFWKQTKNASDCVPLSRGV
jgi:hypothetical protein